MLNQVAIIKYNGILCFEEQKGKFGVLVLVGRF